MLNFPFLKPQINKMIEGKKDEEGKFAEKIGIAYSELKLKSREWESLSEKVKLSKTFWLLAGIHNPLETVSSLPTRPLNYTVLASDGSQVFPDRHEALPCYLINIGSVVIHYGTGGKAYLNSYPRFFYNNEDRFTTWDGKKIPADSTVISEKRNLMEFEEILKLVEGCRDRENVIAVSDGTLILWRLEGTPNDFRNEVLTPFIQIMDKLKDMRVPIAGYTSFPGSTDVINALRVGLCPERISYCSECPYAYLPEIPCAPIEGLTDRILFSRILKPGERSSVFGNSSKILDFYGDHRIYFFYLNIGEEIARVEIPKWVAEDGGLLNLVHTLIFDQAKKGGGYPVSLIEAHEQAVVKAKDRDFFFELVREALIRSEFKVTVSRKGLSKRSPEV
ncbi:MAG TPA: DNA double-strand break repair nuclease NurA [Thermodesulfobacteriota bacterium]|nr:DNA double-strand break repair nuclease NurA [Thermodesulfobacteriota bacterium]